MLNKLCSKSQIDGVKPSIQATRRRSRPATPRVDFFSSARTAPLSGRKAIEQHFAAVIQGAKITIGVQDAR